MPIKDEELLAQEIGEFFGCYFMEDNQYCIDSGEKIYRYPTLENMFRDWVDTLVEMQNSNPNNPSCRWENEVKYIYTEVLQKMPTGVRYTESKDGNRWQSSIDVTVPGQTGLHGKNLFLGTYSSIVDAISKRKEFFEKYVKNKESSLEYIAMKAEEMRLEAKAETQKERRNRRGDER